MRVALRSTLASLGQRLNPFSRPGALRLSRQYPHAYTALNLFAATAGYLYLYLFPALLLSLPVALYALIPGAQTPLEGFLIGMAVLLLLLGGLVTVSVATLRFNPPSGLELRERDCPRLYALLEELGEVYGDVRIDRVVLRDRFDVRVVKTPRGVFSLHCTHTLVIGLPVLLTLSPLDVHVLVARRVGQLAGGRLALANALYYLRDIWTQYLDACERRPAWQNILLVSFYRWYVPRYRALSLGTARRCELEADRQALDAINEQDTVRGITGQLMMHDYLTHTFWPQMVEAARYSQKPGRQPYAVLAETFETGLAQEQLQALMQRVATRRSNPNSTLPSLAERLARLGQRKPLLPRRLPVSAARFYLGGLYERCIDIMDKRSSQKVRSELIRQAGRSSRVA